MKLLFGFDITSYSRHFLPRLRRVRFSLLVILLSGL